MNPYNPNEDDDLGSWDSLLADAAAEAHDAAEYYLQHPYLIRVCRQALDSWLRLIEHEANGGATWEVDGGGDALAVMTQELLEGAPSLPLLAALEAHQVATYTVGGPNDGGE